MVPQFKLLDQLFMSINSLCWSLCTDDVSEKWSWQATIWEKLNERNPSNKRPLFSPKFETSARFKVFIVSSVRAATKGREPGIFPGYYKSGSRLL